MILKSDNVKETEKQNTMTVDVSMNGASNAENSQTLTSLATIPLTISDESSRLINDVPLCQDSRVGDVDYFRLLGEKFTVKSSVLRPNTYFHTTAVCDTNNQVTYCSNMSK